MPVYYLGYFFESKASASVLHPNCSRIIFCCIFCQSKQTKKPFKNKIQRKIKAAFWFK